MAVMEEEQEALPMEFVNLPEDFKPAEPQSDEPCSATECFMTVGEPLWGNHSARDRIRTTMLRWGVAVPKATGFWGQANPNRIEPSKGNAEKREMPPRHSAAVRETSIKTQAKTCANPVEAAALSVGSHPVGSDSTGADGILDTGATKTVIGSHLIASFLGALSPALRAQVTRGPCNVLFRFGNQGTLSAKHAMHVPLGPLTLRIAVVPGHTPLLLSNTLMRVLPASINMEEQQLDSPHARHPVKLKLTPKGLYLISVDDLAKALREERLHVSTTFHVETETPEQRNASAETESRQQPGSRETSIGILHGGPCAAHERPGADDDVGGRGQHVLGGPGPHQGEDRKDIQRLHLRRDVEEPQRMGEMDDQVLRGQRQAPAQDASPLRAAQVGPGRDEPPSLPAEDLGQGQEQGVRFSRILHGDRGRPEWSQDGDGGRAGCLGDGRGRGHVERDCPHPERGGSAVRSIGQHGEHDVADPHSDPVPAAEHDTAAIPGRMEQLNRLEPEEAFVCAGDIDAHEHDHASEISGRDHQL